MHTPPQQVTPHQSPKSAPLDSTDCSTSTGEDGGLPRYSGRRIFVTWELPKAAGRLGRLGGGPSCPAGRQERELACTSSADGPFILGDRFPTPPPLCRVGAEGPRPPGLKFKLLVKKKRSWNGERKHPFRHPVSPCVYSMLGQLRWLKTTFPTRPRVPLSVSLPLSLDESRPQACHVSLGKGGD